MKSNLAKPLSREEMKNVQGGWSYAPDWRCARFEEVPGPLGCCPDSILCDVFGSPPVCLAPDRCLADPI